MYERLHRILLAAGRPTVCVLGDVLLDTYVWGSVNGVSPEGPIPLLEPDRAEHRPGGAAAVAAMLAALGARASCAGLVGEDEAGVQLAEALRAGGVDTSALVPCTGRSTACRTRYLGYVQSAGRAVQQLLRVDQVQRRPLAPEQAAALREAALPLIDACQAVLVQDLVHGACGPDLLGTLQAHAVKEGKPFIVDPERADDCSPYRGATCLLLNRAEAQAFSRVDMTGPDRYAEAARALIEGLGLGSVILKLDREGLYYASADGAGRLVPARRQEAVDETGAGDMVSAALALVLAAGMPLGEAAELANFAAAIEVGRRGAALIHREELIDDLVGRADPAARKIRPLDELLPILEGRRARGEKVAFTNGCFDLLHLGHIELLRRARSHGDLLVVGVNSDESVRALKGPSRPINSQETRARMLAGMEEVDYVVVFDTVSVLPLIEQVRPDVLVKGGDYDKTGVVGWELVEGYGGRVELAPVVTGLSTSDIIKRISENDEGTDRKRP